MSYSPRCPYLSRGGPLPHSDRGSHYSATPLGEIPPPLRPTSLSATRAERAPGRGPGLAVCVTPFQNVNARAHGRRLAWASLRLIPRSFPISSPLSPHPVTPQTPPLLPRLSPRSTSPTPASSASSPSTTSPPMPTAWSPSPSTTRPSPRRTRPRFSTPTSATSTRASSRPSPPPRAPPSTTRSAAAPRASGARSLPPPPSRPATRPRSLPSLATLASPTTPAWPT
jgi:hypothetical protein